MRSIRCASGLGDSVYLRAIADHLAQGGEAITALSNYPEIFIGSPCRVEPFRRERVDIVAHYVTGKGNQGTNQWQDVCLAAGVARPVPFRFDWTVQNEELVDGILERADGLPVVLVQGGRTPMGRTDGFGKELLPDRQAFEAAVGAIRPRCYLVAVGKADPIYRAAVDEDLTGQTTVADLLDLFKACSAVIAQVGFAVPMAEIFDRPLLAVWAASGLISRDLYVRQITPAKIFAKPTSRFVMDDWPLERIAEHATRFAAKAARAVPA